MWKQLFWWETDILWDVDLLCSHQIILFHYLTLFDLYPLRNDRHRPLTNYNPSHRAHFIWTWPNSAKWSRHYSSAITMTALTFYCRNKLLILDLFRYVCDCLWCCLYVLMCDLICFVVSYIYFYVFCCYWVCDAKDILISIRLAGYMKVRIKIFSLLFLSITETIFLTL